ncbi:MAG: hypothetical protein Kow0096_12220 [Thiohalomonadaceae bacterium]
MNSMFRQSVLGSAIVLGLLASGQAAAELSANVGFASEYIFRGIYQAESSASAGVDYGHESGIYVGTWAADVNNGIEYDIYGGYNGAVGDLSYGVGFTGYYYSDDFDGSYEEFNLSAGYGPFTVTHNIGTYNGSDIGGTDADYTFTTVKAEYNGLYALYGAYGDEADGSYVQVGYATDVSGFTVGGYLLKNDADLDNISADGDGETRLVFTVNKAFDL